ncbi:unannotated protein [freshwater metagenome]|uniref:Orotidine 5'-phosphate decarboxylase n=1 Tax=freshwater metagenome TaxID=449393 RepID=A0A6J7XV95_9ZZZZ|nr:orotidine-5'-phosphate decarboxylase [Actinomycetota bacterium]
MSNRAPIILAVDTSSISTAISWIKATEDYVSGYKLGLEFFLACGLDGVKEVSQHIDLDLFLDLKLHDIPNTVSKAAKAIEEFSPRFLTVHASGGTAMIAAAVHSLPNTLVTAVTILTSLSALDVHEIGYSQPPLESAVRLASLAVKAGAKALVCSPQETSAIRNEVGAEPVIITPGVRPIESSGGDDQVRTMTPSQAIRQGANYVVIGRPVTGGDSLQDIHTRAKKIAADILIGE